MNYIEINDIDNEDVYNSIYDSIFGCNTVSPLFGENDNDLPPPYDPCYTLVDNSKVSKKRKIESVESVESVQQYVEPVEYVEPHVEPVEYVEPNFEPLVKQNLGYSEGNFVFVNGDLVPYVENPGEKKKPETHHLRCYDPEECEKWSLDADFKDLVNIFHHLSLQNLINLLDPRFHDYKVHNLKHDLLCLITHTFPDYFEVVFNGGDHESLEYLLERQDVDSLRTLIEAQIEVLSENQIKSKYKKAKTEPKKKTIKQKRFTESQMINKASNEIKLELFEQKLHNIACGYPDDSFNEKYPEYKRLVKSLMKPLYKESLELFWAYENGFLNY
jgi:hypothetical protein